MPALAVLYFSPSCPGLIPPPQAKETQIFALLRGFRGLQNALVRGKWAKGLGQHGCGSPLGKRLRSRGLACGEGARWPGPVQLLEWE